MALKLRPNVCMLVLNGENRLFLGERLDEPGVWQFPQGGIEPELSEKANVLKELREELGADESLFEIVRRFEHVHEYQFAKPRSYGLQKWDGQRQHFWLVRFLGADTDIKLDRYQPEMVSFRWCSIPEVRKLAEPKRLKGYGKPLEDLEAELAAAFHRK